MIKVILAIALMTLSVVSASAATIKYDATQTVTEPLSVTEATTIEVAKGAVVTYAPSAVISGAQPIDKTGAGQLLICSPNSSFTGGFTVSAGYLIASNSTALGTADVTVLGQRTGYKGACAVGFWGVGGTWGDKTDLSPIYYANNIKVTGTSSKDYPALIGYGRAAQLTGSVTADKDFYFWDDEESVYSISRSAYLAYERVTNLVFNSSITVNGIMGHDGWAAIIFKDKVKAKAFYCKKFQSSTRGNQNACYYFYDTCSFNAVTNQRHALHFYTADVFKGASLNWIDEPAYGNISVYGNNQSVGELASMTGSIVSNTCWQFGRDSLAPSVLTITGFGTGKREAITQMVLTNAISLVIDARDEFTQTFYTHPDCYKRYSIIRGSITVRKGTLKFSGITRFYASALTVKTGAKFLNESTDPTSLMALQDMTVEDGATVVFATPTKLSLNSCTFGDQRLPPGIGYTHENFPVIPENLTIDVVGGMPKAKTLAVWTGAAGDGKMSNLENWRVDGVIPSELDLTSGTTAVRIDGGTEMIPDFEGVRVHSIVNNRTAGADVPLFYVGAKGKTLMVDGQIVSNAKAWWAFRGTIAPPNGITQSGNSRNGPYCVTHINGGERDTDFQCIFFAGVTMKKPIWMYTNYTGGHPFVGAAGTYNLIEADATSDGGGNNMPDVRSKGTVEFTGGYVQDKRPMLVGGGELRFSGKPVDNSVGYGVEVGSLVVASTGNQFRAYGETSASDVGKLNRGIRVYGSGALLKFECDNALADNDLEQLQLTGSNEIYVDFGCYTQRFSRVYGANTHKISRMTGEYPAMLEVKGGTKYTAAKYFIGLTNRVQITGGVGFHYLGNGPAQSAYGAPAGADDVFVLMGQDFQTTGNLEVSGGTLELADGATWRNASNFVVRCNQRGVVSRLKFASEDQVDRRLAEILLEGDGAQIYIPTGVNLRVRRVFVNGENVGHGTFESGETTGVMANRITGGGTLYVHGDYRGSIIRFW